MINGLVTWISPRGSWVRLPLGAQKILFLSISTWERFFIIYTLSKSPIHLSFIHIHHFDALSLAVWQDTCHTYKNLVYDLAPHQSPIAQWLERPTGILEGHGFDSRWRLRKFFFRVFQGENTSLLFTIYPSHQSIFQSFDYLLMITMQFNSNFQNSITTFCTQYNVSALCGINWRVLSQSACWNLCMFIINTISIQ